MWSKPIWIQSVAPTVNDDRSAGFTEGVYWFDTVAGTLYLLEDDAIGAASWTAIASSSGVTARSGTESVTTAGTAITFSTPLASANYALTIRCVDSNGNSQACGITSKAASGFTATPPRNGTIDYIAISHV